MNEPTTEKTLSTLLEKYCRYKNSTMLFLCVHSPFTRNFYWIPSDALSPNPTWGTTRAENFVQENEITNRRRLVIYRSWIPF